MILWILAGYVVTAVAFYSYIVSTAQEDPGDKAATVITLADWQRNREESGRKAA